MFLFHRRILSLPAPTGSLSFQSSRKGTPTYFLFPHLLIVARVSSQERSVGSSWTWDWTIKTILFPRRNGSAWRWRGNEESDECRGTSEETFNLTGANGENGG